MAKGGNNKVTYFVLGTRNNFEIKEMLNSHIIATEHLNFQLDLELVLMLITNVISV